MSARFVENSFWNFDALFQPQRHPARDSHDTFFVKDPELSTKFPMDYLERYKFDITITTTSLLPLQHFLLTLK